MRRLRALLCRFGWHLPMPGVQSRLGVGFQCASCPVFVFTPNRRTRRKPNG